MRRPHRPDRRTPARTASAVRASRCRAATARRTTPCFAAKRALEIAAERIGIAMQCMQTIEHGRARRRRGAPRIFVRSQFDQRRSRHGDATPPDHAPDRRRANRGRPLASARSRLQQDARRVTARPPDTTRVRCTFSAKSARSASASRNGDSSTCPPTSMKNAYCHSPVCAGRDSMRFMLMPRRASGSSTLEQRARLVAHEHHQRGAVVARGREQLAADHQEARGVVGRDPRSARRRSSGHTRAPRSRRRSPPHRRHCARGARLRRCSTSGSFSASGRCWRSQAAALRRATAPCE